jgi:hypothetical protein
MSQRTPPVIWLHAGGLLLLLLGLVACTSGDDQPALPIGCDLGDNPSQDATLACYQDLDVDGNGMLSGAELDRLPRTRGRFEELDIDASGAISPIEFQDGTKTLPQRAGGKGV